MPDEETLSRRLRAVERSLTDGDHEVDALRDAGEQVGRIESLESQLADAEDRIAELEAVTQALRGYVGNVRSVNEDVEQRADAAMAAVERLEDRLDVGPQSAADDKRSSVRPSTTARSQPQASVRQGQTDHREPDDGPDESIVTRVRDAF